MTQKYALPCPCGKTVPVDTRQAGETIRCAACEKSLEVPKLREIRALDVIPQSDALRPKRRWSALESSLFVLGLLLLVASAAASYYTFAYRLKYDVDKPDPSKIQFAHDMNEIPLVNSWQVWQQFAKKRIDSRPTPYHVLAQSQVRRLDRWLWAFAVTAALGALSILTCVVLRLIR